MKTVILDTSVVIKWFKSKGEDKIKDAKQYLLDYSNKRIDIYISPITVFEFLNISINDAYLPPQRWQENIQKLINLSLKTINFDVNLLKTTYLLGKRYQISAYDASYIALAQSLKADFITADKKLVKKVKLPYVKAL